LSGDEQVEALLLAHLTDDDLGGPHPQRLLDQPAQRDLPRALQGSKATLLHRPSGAKRVLASRTQPPHNPTPIRLGISARRRRQHGEHHQLRRLSSLVHGREVGQQLSMGFMKILWWALEKPNPAYGLRVTAVIMIAAGFHFHL
jgi:hypothetical protein